ncbi:MAG: cytochrome c [Thiohalomonadales bacterium]
MNTWSRTLIIIGAALMSNPFAMASDIANGKKKYDENCHACHTTKIHTRPNRIIHTYEDLVGRVKFCDGAAKSHFTDTEMSDVIDYLNDAFYKFVK